jgi:hypothetical protein
MKIRSPLSAAFVFLVTCSIGISSLAHQPNTRRPNIVFFLADDTDCNFNEVLHPISNYQ